jgi:type II restriction enzyme
VTNLPLDLANYEQKTAAAVKNFWETREAAKQKQLESGNADQGERAGVTGGKNMDGFVELFTDVIAANNLSGAKIYRNSRLVTLPGFFRPTKLWDLLVINNGKLAAAIELKSQVGPRRRARFLDRVQGRSVREATETFRGLAHADRRNRAVDCSRPGQFSAFSNFPRI